MTTRPTLHHAVVAAALLGLCGLAAAQSESAKPTRPVAHAKAVKPKAATSHQQLRSEAKGLALAIDTTETISASQLDISKHVFTGRTACEFNQNVDVDAVPDHPGFFRVAFGKHHYVMVPEQTTTGAVRLVDKKAGALWLQIPAKSMLIDTKGGHRLVDACQSAEQRAAFEASSNVAKAGPLQ